MDFRIVFGVKQRNPEEGPAAGRRQRCADVGHLCAGVRNARRPQAGEGSVLRYGKHYLPGRFHHRGDHFLLLFPSETEKRITFMDRPV